MMVSVYVGFIRPVNRLNLYYFVQFADTGGPNRTTSPQKTRRFDDEQIRIRTRRRHVGRGLTARATARATGRAGRTRRAAATALHAGQSAGTTDQSGAERNIH